MVFPLLNCVKVLILSKGISFNEKLEISFFINSKQSFIIESVVYPKKSNFMSPAFSTYFIEN